MRVAEKSKAKAKFSQARKSDGKVMTRLERQGKRKAWKSVGEALTRSETHWNGVDKWRTRREYQCAGKDMSCKAMAKNSKD